MPSSLLHLLRKSFSVEFNSFSFDVCDVRRRTSTYVDVRWRTSTYVEIHRRTSTYITIRQLTSTYVEVHLPCTSYFRVCYTPWENQFGSIWLIVLLLTVTPSTALPSLIAEPSNGNLKDVAKKITCKKFGPRGASSPPGTPQGGGRDSLMFSIETARSWPLSGGPPP